MKKESIFDLVTGAYLLGFGILLLNEIGFDLRRFGTLEAKPIPSYLLMPVASELLVMFLFLILFVGIFVFSKRFQKEVFVEGFSEFIENGKKINLSMLFPLISPGFVILFFVFLLSFPSYIKNEIYSFYFLVFFIFSGGKMLYAFLEPLMASSRNEDNGFISSNKPFLLHLTFTSLIIALSLLVTIPFRYNTPSPLIFSSVIVVYYFGVGLQSLWFFVSEMRKKPEKLPLSQKK